ncbi:MAG TPA: acyl-CoA reductase [Acidimicrobiales bacterium]|nr:acyl-CoA reductase [Acidimicrobiales bacterium]
MTITALPVDVGHVLKGQYVPGGEIEHCSSVGPFLTPALNVDELIWLRTERGPAFDVPMAEILDFLQETGKRLTLKTNGPLRESLRGATAFSPLSARVLENTYRALPSFFERSAMELQVESQVGIDAIDGWRTVSDWNGEPRGHVRAFPPRLVHMLAGNAVGVTAVSIVRSALTKGVHLLKLPSNDLFTATAILRTMADVDPTHPVVRSFSAVYWQGGDVSIESAIYRPQYFDKIVAWGGEAAVRHVQKYVGPGLELVAFDPKVSISIIGHEAFETEEVLREVASAAATDVAVLNQDACVSSRHQFVEASIEDTDRYCSLLADELAVDRETSDSIAQPPPAELREELSILQFLEPEYKVFGKDDGSGIVVRSLEPVEFALTSKTVNVIPVKNVGDAVPYANVATQTVGVFPSERKAELRDGLAGAGVQRLVQLGHASREVPAMPHDGMYPLQRLVRWIADED